jgi:hypothetical protein
MAACNLVKKSTTATWVPKDQAGFDRRLPYRVAIHVLARDHQL